MSQASLAERIGISERSVRRLEKGDANTALHVVVRALHLFGELERFNLLLDSSEDVLGLFMMDEQLPRRIRNRRPKMEPGAL